MNTKNKVGEPLATNSNDYEPVFLVGMNGSGTTMLLDSIGRHPDLFAFPRETRFIPSLIGSVKNFGCLTKDENFLKLWKYLCAHRVIVRENSGETIPIPANWREFGRNLASVIDAVFRHFSSKVEKVRWCEKTPQHVQHIPKLYQLFPKAKFIHIIRDGRDCAASINRRYKRAPEYSLFRWKKIVQLGRADGALLGSAYMEVRYEDITENPEFWMRKVCEFIDLPFNKNILQSCRPMQEKTTTLPNHTRESTAGLEPNSGKWRSYFSDNQITSMENIAGEYLAELNYPVISRRGTQDPSIVYQSYWKWGGRAKQFFGLIQRGRRYRWRVILNQVTRSLGQSKTNRY